MTALIDDKTLAFYIAHFSSEYRRLCLTLHDDGIKPSDGEDELQYIEDPWRRQDARKELFYRDTAWDTFKLLCELQERRKPLVDCAPAEPVISNGNASAWLKEMAKEEHENGN